MMKRLFCIVALVTLLILVDVSAVQGNSLPDSAYVSGLSGHPQSYSLSCESRSAVDLAAFWEINIGETEFLQSLPYSDNPEKGFVGSPNEAWGYIPPHAYGVYATPVAETLTAYGLEAIGLSNLSWNDLRGEINAGHPVIVWVIGDMWNGTSVEYESQDGSTAMVAAYEHTMILTGYNQDSVQVVDAYSGQYTTYPLNTFIKSWSVLGNMAVFGSREVAEQVNAPAETQGDSYTVQPGDYLIALAKRFNTSWLELAQLNSIGFPYIIHPGQGLKLPDIAAPEPEPANEVLSFQVRLPMIQRNFVAQSAAPVISAPTAVEPTQPVIALGSSILSHFSYSMGVDWQFLTKLKDLIHPYLIHPGEILKLK